MDISDDLQPGVAVAHDDDAKDPQDMYRELVDIRTSMEWLTDLHDTVSQEGVSQADIQALHQIRSTLMGVGVAFDPTPAIENHPVMSYFEERSSMNVDVGLEGIAQTIIQTIRTWLRKLVDYIQKIYKWFKKTMRGEERMHDLLKIHSNIFAIARAARKEMVSTSRMPLSSDASDKLKSAQNDFLTGLQLPKSPLQLAILGHQEYAVRLRALEKDSQALARMTLGMVEELGSILSTSPSTTDRLNDDAKVVGVMLIEEVETLETEMAQRNYLVRNINHLRNDKGRSYDVFEESLPSVSTRVSSYEELFDVYDELVKMLKELQRANFQGKGEDKDLSREVSHVLQETSKHVDQLKTLGTFFYNATRLKLKTMKAWYEYEQAAMSKTYHDLKSTAPDVRAVERLERIYKKAADDIQKAVK